MKPSQITRQLSRLFTLDVGWGTKVRDTIDRVSSMAYPYIKFVIPNFRAFHYFYIISMTILISILLYPVRNIRYIDALFFAAGCSTQSGLNTFNVNELKLYQQIIMYLTTMFCTPIFIHGSLLFVRLYWFERQFDNIRHTSKMNSRLRRSATLAARTDRDRGTELGDLDAESVTYGRRGTDEIDGRIGGSRIGANDHELNGSALRSSLLRVLLSASLSKISRLKFSRLGNTSLKNVRLKSLSMENSDLNSKFDSSLNLDPSAPQSDRISQKKGPNDTARDLEKFNLLTLDLEKLPGAAFDSLDHESINSINSFNSYNEVNSDNSDNSRSSLNSNNHTQTPVNNSKVTNSKAKADYHGNSNGPGIKFSDLPRPAPRKEFAPSDIQKSISMLSQNQMVPEDDAVLIIKAPNEIEEDGGHIYTTRSQIHFEMPKKPKKRKLFQDDDDSIDLEHREDDSVTEFSLRLGAQGGRGVDGKNAQNADDAVEDEKSMHRAISHIILPSADASGHRFAKRSNTLDGEVRRGSFVKSPTFERLLRHNVRRKRHLGRTNLRKSIRRMLLADSTGSLRRLTSASYLSWSPTIGRNSNFIHLTDEQKDELGGVEYRAVKLLSTGVIIYYVGLHIIAFLMLVPWILHSQHREIVREQGISPVWWGFFTAASAFNDLGLTLTADSMNSFNNSVYVLLVMSFFIVVGNTGFPVFLRFTIWILAKVTPELSQLRELLEFLLDHPRRCFTLLFPSGPTWWLLLILVVLNAVDWIFFIILDIHNPVLDVIPAGFRVVDGLFQSFSTRTAGFSVVSLLLLHAAVQVSYMIMMYISVLPLAISIRRTNVYEEQSLGVYAKGAERHDENSAKLFISDHLKNQLSFDLWFISLGLFVICISEGGKFAGDPDFNIFAVLFEVVSAYGCVGLSLGYPGVDESFSYKFNTVSKLVIIAMMIRGRHRGLPYSLDRAIMLPSKKMARRDRMQLMHQPTALEENPLRRTITREIERRKRHFRSASITSWARRERT